ncbi:MAG TPA: hypothetical protein VLA21_11150 [Candidatus Limnocylindria bacterium]|nr:hypothetical protein [Candidatus Limnocylindria bacterium]
MALLIIVLLAAAGALLLVLFDREDREERRQLMALGESPQYKLLREKLRQLERYDVDQIRIECSGVTVVSVSPAHTLLSFSFKQNGNSKRNGSVTRLYAELIARDFPLFARHGVDKQRRYRVYRVNGKTEHAFAFIMRRGYKDWLLAQRNTAQLRIY